MKRALEIVDLEELRPLLDRSRVIGCVRQALIQQAAGQVQSPLPGQLLFSQPPGDCHIKFGHIGGSSTFAVKIATGFYDNPRHGLPSNHGLILVFDAHTGAPRVLLKDDGWLTAWRTAAATALAAATLAPEDAREVGIIGTGLQARLAIEWLPETLGIRSFAVWGRSEQKARELAEELTTPARSVRSIATVEELLEDCRIVVTATPSAAPLFGSSQARPGTHFVGVGADSPGKQELPPHLFTRAAHVLTDDHAQCLDHGDFGRAVRVGAIEEHADIMLGHVFSGQIVRQRKATDITVVDLTGIAAEDIAIADLFCSLRSRS
jgi:ornithine cyclodeaminase